MKVKNFPEMFACNVFTVLFGFVSYYFYIHGDNFFRLTVILGLLMFFLANWFLYLIIADLYKRQGMIFKMFFIKEIEGFANSIINKQVIQNLCTIPIFEISVEKKSKPKECERCVLDNSSACDFSETSVCILKNQDAPKFKEYVKTEPFDPKDWSKEQLERAKQENCENGPGCLGCSDHNDGCSFNSDRQCRMEYMSNIEAYKQQVKCYKKKKKLIKIVDPSPNRMRDEVARIEDFVFGLQCRKCNDFATCEIQKKWEQYREALKKIPTDKQ